MAELIIHYSLANQTLLKYSLSNQILLCSSLLILPKLDFLDWKEFWEAYQVLQCAIFCKLKKASLTTTPQQKKYRKNYKKVTQSLSTSYTISLALAKFKDLIEEVDRLWSDEWMWWKPISPIFFCLSSKKNNNVFRILLILFLQSNS